MQLKCLIRPGYIFLFFLLVCLKFNSFAQLRSGSEKKHRSMYFSLGFNSATYGNAQIHVDQAKLGNNFDLADVKGDNTAYTSASFPLTYSYKLGYFFDCKQTTGAELSFDPLNYHVTDGQFIQVKGKVDSVATSQKIVFSTGNGDYYYLSSLNLFLVSAVKRLPLLHPRLNRINLDLYVKAGVGPVMPTFRSSLDGHVADAGKFKLSGWNAGAEITFRATFWRHLYLEIAEKYDYASLSGMSVYKGTAKQHMTTMLFTGNVGYSFPLDKDTRWLYYRHGPERL